MMGIMLDMAGTPAPAPKKSGGGILTTLLDVLKYGPFVGEARQNRTRRLANEQQQDDDGALARQFKQMQMQQMMQPKQQSPTEFERLLEGSGVQRGTPQWTTAMQQAVAARIDPEIIVQTPGGPYVGPRSGLGAAMGETAPTVAPMGGMRAVAQSGNFADINGAGQMIQSMGAQGFLGWQQKHGTPVLVNSPEEMAALPPGTRVVSPDGREGVKR